MNPTAAIPPVYGTAQPFQALTENKFDEIVSFSTQGNDLIVLDGINETLTAHKIYAWLFTTDAIATDNICECEIQFWNGSNSVGKMPLVTGISKSVGSVVTASKISVCTNGGLTGEDSVGLLVAGPAAGQPTALIMQPFNFGGSITKVTLNCKFIKNVSDARAFLLVISALKGGK